MLEEDNRDLEKVARMQERLLNRGGPLNPMGVVLWNGFLAGAGFLFCVLFLGGVVAFGVKAFNAIQGAGGSGHVRGP